MMCLNTGGYFGFLQKIMQKMLRLVALRRRMVRVVANTRAQAASASFANVSVRIAPQLKGQFVHPSLLRDMI
jgi:hypothetical protein